MSERNKYKQLAGRHTYIDTYRQTDRQTDRQNKRVGNGAQTSLQHVLEQTDTLSGGWSTRLGAD